MKVLVCGSRDWDVPGFIHSRIANTAAFALKDGDKLTVIHGGARGADREAASACASLGIEQRVYPADWKEHGKRAGILRTLEMLDDRPELVMAFQCNGSPGTQFAIDEAARRGIAAVVHRVEGEEVVVTWIPAGPGEEAA